MSRHQSGFSLIELMLALALGMIVVVGIVQLFVGNAATYSLLNGQARLQENGRMALEFLSRSARSSGYLGCGPTRENIVWKLNGEGSQVYEFDIFGPTEGINPIQGYHGDGGNWTPAIGELPRNGVNLYTGVAGNAEVPVGDIAANTDVLTVRAFGLRQARLATIMQPNENPEIEAPGGASPIAANEIVALADCDQAAIFRVTGTAAAGADAVELQRNAGAGAFDNEDTGLLSDIGRSYGPDAIVAPIMTTIFYVAPSGGGLVNNRGDVPLALWMKDGPNAPVELIAGIEDLDILFGIDTSPTDNVISANRYVEFNTVPDPKDIVTVRIAVTANSIDEVTDQGDGLLRRTFSETILLRNSDPRT